MKTMKVIIHLGQAIQVMKAAVAVVLQVIDNCYLYNIIEFFIQ